MTTTSLIWSQWLAAFRRSYVLLSKPEPVLYNFIMQAYFLKDANSKDLQGKKVKEHRSVSEK